MSWAEAKYVVDSLQNVIEENSGGGGSSLLR